MAWLIALWELFVRFWPIVGMSFVVPFAAGAIARCGWSKSAKTWTAFLVSIVVGILGTLVVGIALTPVTLGVFVVSVFTIAQLAYPEFKKLKITAAWLDALLAWGGK
jgi:hypothetical protein